MALITCKHCGKQLSDFADACPHCGGLTDAKQQTVKQTRRKKMKNAIGIFLSLLGVLGILLTVIVPKDERNIIWLYIAILIIMILGAVLWKMFKGRAVKICAAVILCYCLVIGIYYSPYLMFYFRYNTANSIERFHNKEISYSGLSIWFEDDFVIMNYKGRQQRYRVNAVYGGCIDVSVPSRDMIELFGSSRYEYTLFYGSGNCYVRFIPNYPGYDIIFTGNGCTTKDGIKASISDR